MAAPTPGPWHVPEFAPWQIVDSRHVLGNVLAQVHTDARHGRSEAEAHANARLMAASPTMYQLLVKMLPLLEDWHEDDGRASPLWREVREILAAVEGSDS